MWDQDQTVSNQNKIIVLFEGYCRFINPWAEYKEFAAFTAYFIALSTTGEYKSSIAMSKIIQPIPIPRRFFGHLNEFNS